MAGEAMSRSVIYRTPLQERISDDFPGNYAFTRTGVEFGVMTQRGDVIWSKEVWQRGTWLPFRPCYERRIRRAKRKAEKVWSALEGLSVAPDVTPTAARQ